MSYLDNALDYAGRIHENGRTATWPYIVAMATFAIVYALLAIAAAIDGLNHE